LPFGVLAAGLTVLAGAFLDDVFLDDVFLAASLLLPDDLVGAAFLAATFILGVAFLAGAAFFFGATFLVAGLEREADFFAAGFAGAFLAA
jgi:hypothetical protein